MRILLRKLVLGVQAGVTALATLLAGLPACPCRAEAGTVPPAPNSPPHCCCAPAEPTDCSCCGHEQAPVGQPASSVPSCSCRVDSPASPAVPPSSTPRNEVSIEVVFPAPSIGADVPVLANAAIHLTNPSSPPTIDRVLVFQHFVI